MIKCCWLHSRGGLKVASGLRKLKRLPNYEEDDCCEWSNMWRNTKDNIAHAAGLVVLPAIKGSVTHDLQTPFIPSAFAFFSLKLHYSEMAGMSGLTLAVLLLFTKAFAENTQLLPRLRLFWTNACNVDCDACPKMRSFFRMHDASLVLT